jgi:hypothetical protein
MRRGQYFSGNYGSALGSTANAANLIAQAGATQGQMFANLGKIAAESINKYTENKQKKEEQKQAASFIENYLINNPEMAGQFGIKGSDLVSFEEAVKQGASAIAKNPKGMETVKGLLTMEQERVKAEEASKVRALQMAQIRQNMARQNNADLQANQDLMADNQFMQSLMSQTTSPQAQRQADIARPGLPALGNADARNRFMQAQLQQPQNQVPVSSLGSQDFGRFASREGLDPKLSVARMEALRQAEVASQPKPMTPKELADYEGKLIANETDRIKLNELQNPPKPPAPPEPVYIEAALDAIDDAITLVGKDSIFNPTAGFGSETAKSIGGSDAADLEAALSTITSAVGFKRLQDMREASPTGGALGSVSERELSQLNAALGSISQKQSPEQLKKNLLKIKDHYQKAVDAINAQRIAYNSGLTFKTQEEALKYIQSQKSSNAITTDQGNYTIPGLSVEAQ